MIVFDHGGVIHLALRLLYILVHLWQLPGFNLPGTPTHHAQGSAGLLEQWFRARAHRLLQVANVGLGRQELLSFAFASQGFNDSFYSHEEIGDLLLLESPDSLIS